jgi:methyl-accepting chemotaxis protein
MKLYQRILVAPGVALVFLALFGVVAYRTVGIEHRATQEIYGVRFGVYEKLGRASAEIDSVHAGVYRLATWIGNHDAPKVARMSADLANRVDAAAKIVGDLLDTPQLTADEKREMEAIRGHVARYKKHVTTALDLATVDVNMGLSALQTADKTFQELRATIDALTEIERALAQTRFEEATVATRRASFVSAIVFLLAVAGAAAATMLATRSVTGPMSEAMLVADRVAQGDLSARVEASGSDEVGRLLGAVGRMAEKLRHTIGETKAGANALASAVSQISGSARRTVQAAQQQATAVQETTTSTAELAETVRVTGQRATEVQHAMDRTMETGQDIRGDLAEAQTVVGLVREEMRTIVSSIQGLVGRNQQIGEIIENVRDVADQTQLLAVNAGIEAAKAGEFGRGFSVVASEMKALADQSKKAAQRIREIVGEVQRATAESVRTVETGQERLQEALLPVGSIIPKVEQLTVQVEDSGQSLRQILAIVQQQTVGIDQINQAMKVVQEAVQESLVQSQQLEAGADSLGSLAGQLNDSVAGYRF